MRKKKLFIITSIFTLTFFHILSIYLLYDASRIPTSGGTFTEAIIGEVKDIHPLKPLSETQERVVSLLFRSLMKYDEKEKKFIPDIASCNIKNLTEIECKLQNNISWSNGEPILFKDIQSTFHILKKTNIHPSLASILANVSLEQKGDTFIFKNKTPDIHFLLILLQPIISNETLESLTQEELYHTWNFKKSIYSGPYRLQDIYVDKTYGTENMILVKNEKYKDKNIFIETYKISFFKNISQIQKQQKYIDLYIETRGEENIFSSQFFQQHTYTLNRFHAVFINTQNIQDKKLRQYILESMKREEILEGVESTIPENETFMQAFFKLHTKKQPISQEEFSKIIKKYGYFSPKELATNVLKKIETLENTKSGNIEEENTSLTYIEKPFQKKDNYTTNDNLLIVGTTKGKKVEAVYINNKKLKQYTPGSNNFYYRISTSIGNLQKGKNSYSIEFLIQGKKQHMESFTLYYDPSGNFQEQHTEDKNKDQTSTLIELQKKLSNINTLDPQYFYNENGKPYSITLMYITSKQKQYATIAQNIKNTLEKKGIKVNIVPTTKDEFYEILTKKRNSYDIFIAGIDTNLFPNNLYPYFHSRQIQNGGLNFSNIAYKDLDSILEKMTMYILDEKEQENLQKKYLQIIEYLSIIQILYVEKNTVYISKKIKNYVIPFHIGKQRNILDGILQGNIKEKNQIHFSNKTIDDFIKFVVGMFF